MSDHGSASKGTKDETKSRSSARTQPVHYENTRRFQSNPVGEKNPEQQGEAENRRWPSSLCTTNSSEGGGSGDLRSWRDAGGGDGDSGTSQQPVPGVQPTTFSGLEWTSISDDEFDLDLEKFTEAEDSVYLLNEALIKHFIFVSRSKRPNAMVNLELIEKLLLKGAKVSTADKHGQTVLHEVARNWHVDIASFLIERGAKVDHADNYGRTPLHVAAALNYVEMIALLLQNNANIEARTFDELQTPFHFAAKYDAINALQYLHDNGVNIHAVDYKKRTPLYLAALYGRNDATMLLLQFGCYAGATDTHDQSCLNIILLKMPHVANDALSQFHLIDHSNRIQFFYLKYLEPHMVEDEDTERKMTLELIVKYQIFEVLKHPAVQRLIDLKWDRYGFSGACIALLLKFVFIITWTALMTIVDWEKRHIYNFPQDWWRIALSFVCITEVFLYIGVELRNIIKSQRNLISWKKKEKQKFLQDKKFCHPRYPLEATFIEKELDNLAATKSYCCIDFWYFYGWLVVVLLLAVIFTHVADVILQWNQVIAWLHLQFVAITLPPLWLWNLKHFKPFRYIGPFVSMIGSIIPIIFKFLFIYTQFFIPYAFAYYLIFGGFNELSEFNTLSSCLFTTFRISVIDHYNYNAMLEHDALMTYVLVGTFIGLEAVLAVNLLIAMLIHTFRGDNLSEKLYMQRASILLYLEKLPYFSAKTEELHNYIHAIADPIAEPFYTEEDILEESYLKYAVFEIKTELKELMHRIQKDEHNVFLQQLLRIYGEEEVMGNISTRFSEERVSVILNNVTHLQKAVTMLHSQQDDSYGHLKNSIEKLSKLLETELNYEPRKDYGAASNLSDVEDRTMPLLKLIQRRLSHRSNQDNDEGVEHNKI